MISVWSDGPVIHLDAANDIFPCQVSIFLDHILISDPRHYKLVFSRFTAIYVVECVEKRSVLYHERHFDTQVVYAEVGLLTYLLKCDSILYLWHEMLIVVEELDELIRVYAFRHHFHHCHWLSTFPLLMHLEALVLVSEDNRQFILLGNDLLCRV